MDARLSSIAGREYRQFAAQYYKRPFFVRLSAPADIQRSKSTASSCTNTHEGIPIPRPIEARTVRVDHIALTIFIPSVPIPGSGNKLPDLAHQYGFLPRLSL